MMFQCKDKTVCDNSRDGARRGVGRRAAGALLCDSVRIKSRVLLQALIGSLATDVTWDPKISCPTMLHS